MATKSKASKAIIAEEREQEDIEYMNSFTANILKSFKDAPVRSLMCDKMYAMYLGSTYTFIYNTVPVTVKFNGTTQTFPEPVYNRLVKKLQEVSNSVSPSVVEDQLS